MFDNLIRNLLRIFRRMPITAGLALAFSASVFLTIELHDLFPKESLPDLWIKYSNEIRTFGSFLFALGLAVPFLLYYLRSSAEDAEGTSGETRRRTNEAKTLLANVRQEIDHFQKLVVSRTSADSAIDTSGLIEELRATLTRNVAQDIKKEFERQVATLAYVEKIRQMFANDERRLSDQIAILRKRGNLNLVIGVVTTLLAAITLVLTITFVNPNSDDSKKVAIYFISRISTVVFIEVFSFFFLRLYKSTLEEEKYYQNEITARSARHTAIEAAFSVAEGGAMGKLIELLAGVNQNKGAPPKSEPLEIKEVGALVESAAKVISSFAKQTHGVE
jgi:hypothetical protein